MLGKERRQEEKKISRRELIRGSSKLAVGATIVTAGGLLLGSKTEAKATYPWPYKKLDIDEVGKIAYETYFPKFCSQTIATSIFGPLREKIGKPYTTFPLEAFFWAHGGIEGWGTVCGTLIAVGFVSSLIAGEKDGRNIINDVMYWYSDNYIPIYKPKEPIKASIKSTTKSGTPICHISVGKWMEKEGVGFFTPQRNERCARLSADIAMQTTRLLNAWADGKYKPAHELLADLKQTGITGGTPFLLSCGECHGRNIPKVPGK